MHFRLSPFVRRLASRSRVWLALGVALCLLGALPASGAGLEPAPAPEAAPLGSGTDAGARLLAQEPAVGRGSLLCQIEEIESEASDPPVIERVPEPAPRGERRAEAEPSHLGSRHPHAERVRGPPRG